MNSNIHLVEPLNECLDELVYEYGDEYLDKTLYEYFFVFPHPNGGAYQRFYQ